MQAEATLTAPEPMAEAEAPRARTPAEPATARALWPTFMRRTLPEEMLRREAPARPSA
jgi:hypothetical protein